MKEKLVVPASLKLKGLGITGEEESWVDLCKTIGIDYKGQSAHRLVKIKYPEVHDAICKDCIYDKAKPVKAKAVKGEKPVKAVKDKTVKVQSKWVLEDKATCAGCEVSMLKKSMSTLHTPDFIGGKSYLLCPNCVCSILA